MCRHTSLPPVAGAYSADYIRSGHGSRWSIRLNTRITCTTTSNAASSSTTTAAVDIIILPTVAFCSFG